jgi:sugar lactone lactonase YvrE
VREIDFEAIRGAKVLAKDLYFPECPRFVDGEIYLVDGPAVRAVSLKGDVRAVANVPAALCLGLQIEPDGSLYVGAAFERKIYKAVNGDVSEVADLSGVVDAPNNELVRLPNGALLVGNMGFNIMVDPEPKPGCLLLVSPDGQVKRTGPEIYFPNGMILLDGGKTLLVVGGRGTSVYRLQLAPSGEVISHEVLPLTDAAAADGLGRAKDGSLWYGDMKLGAAVRPAPGGAPDIVVKTGKPHATACTVFEADGEEWLAITTVVSHPTPGNFDKRTGELLLAPLAAVLA